ncbi:MAG: AAA-like domain-containing protein [Candidatus Aminicenantes bacterium]|nr:AAA-like domain-containing protein [Candidatus Aminicenantes bacterium]
MSEQLKGVKIFIMYSHKDENLKQRLEIHLTTLKHKGFINIWHDGKGIPGEDWDKSIKKEMETSDMILPLVSPDFLVSEYIINVELKEAMELHTRGKAEVIPVILRDCDWKSVDPLRKLKVLPEKGKPVKNTKFWSNDDEAFTDILAGIKKAIDLCRDKIAARRYPPGGPLSVDSSNYIIRPADNQLNLLLNTASPATMYLIIGGIQCGKTSLLRKFKANSERQNYHTIHVDFWKIRHKESFTTEEVFGFISQTIDDSSVKKRIGKASENKGDKGHVRWSKEMLLEYLKINLKKEEKTFLIIDSMDLLLSQSKDQETLNELIRWLYMLRTNQTEAPFDRLITIAAMTTLSYSAVYDSPLRTQAANIPILNFGHTEIESLLNIYEIETDIKHTAEKILELFGGQPHLSHLACYNLSQGYNFENIKKRAFMPMNNYRGYWDSVKEVFELVLKIKKLNINMVSVFEILKSEEKTKDDYKVIEDLFEELYKLGIVNLDHEPSSEFIKNAIKKEIKTK